MLTQRPQGGRGASRGASRGPRYQNRTIIPAPRGPIQKAPHPFKTRGKMAAQSLSEGQSTAFAPFLTTSAFAHGLDALEHPCSRSEYSSRNTSSLYRAGAPDAHPTGTAQNPSTGCRDIDHTATIHPPCAAKRPFRKYSTPLGSRDHPASLLPCLCRE